MTMVDPVVHLDHWRWRKDDGVEGSGGATFHELEDTTTGFSSDDSELDTPQRLRMSMHVTAAAIEGGGDGWQLQYNKNTGGWNNVSDVSSNVQIGDSADLTDDDDTTEHGVTFVGTGSFTSDNDGVAEDGKTGNKTHLQNDFWAVEYVIEFIEGDLADGDNIEFKVVNKNGNDIDNLPSPLPDCDITIPAGVGLTIPVAMAQYRRRHESA